MKYLNPAPDRTSYFQLYFSNGTFQIFSRYDHRFLGIPLEGLPFIMWDRNADRNPIFMSADYGTPLLVATGLPEVSCENVHHVKWVIDTENYDRGISTLNWDDDTGYFIRHYSDGYNHVEKIRLEPRNFGQFRIALSSLFSRELERW